MNPAKVLPCRTDTSPLLCGPPFRGSGEPANWMGNGRPVGLSSASMNQAPAGKGSTDDRLVADSESESESESESGDE